MSVHRANDDDGSDVKKMLDVGPGILSQFEQLYAQGHNYPSGVKNLYMGSIYSAQKTLKTYLTGEYTDPHTKTLVKYMQYNIPSKASAGLKKFMEDLEREYEPQIPMKKNGHDVDDLPGSISAENRGQITELRGYIKNLQKSQEETKKNIKRKTDLISMYQKEVEVFESTLLSREQTIRKYQAEIESLGGGAAHTGKPFHAGMRY